MSSKIGWITVRSFFKTRAAATCHLAAKVVSNLAAITILLQDCLSYYSAEWVQTRVVRRTKPLQLPLSERTDWPSGRFTESEVPPKFVNNLQNCPRVNSTWGRMLVRGCQGFSLGTRGLETAPHCCPQHPEEPMTVHQKRNFRTSQYKAELRAGVY